MNADWSKKNLSCKPKNIHILNGSEIDILCDQSEYGSDLVTTMSKKRKEYTTTEIIEKQNEALCMRNDNSNKIVK